MAQNAIMDISDGQKTRLQRVGVRAKRGMTQGQATDALYRYFCRHLEEYVGALVSTGNPVVLGVCDLDGFKSVNTVHGHLAGDAVLQRVAGVLARVMRRGDFVARYGGDEFVIVLPGATQIEAREVSHRVMRAVRDEDWKALVDARAAPEVEHAVLSVVSRGFLAPTRSGTLAARRPGSRGRRGAGRCGSIRPGT